MPKTLISFPLIRLALLCALAAWWPAIARSAAEPAVRTHFIVAIDVSADMRTLNDRHGAIAAAIPRLLFDTSAAAGTPELPVFRPGSDRLSIVYFALTQAPPDDCKTVTGYDARAQYLFTWQEITQPSVDKNTLSEALDGWLAAPCRIVKSPSLSPIVTAESTVAAFVGAELERRGERQLLFDRTYLIIATNDAYNRSPARELAFLAERFQVANTAAARALTERLARYFYIDTPQNWTATVDTFKPDLPLVFGEAAEKISGFPLVLRIAELRPVTGNVNAYLAFSPENDLDRFAIAGDRVRLAGSDGAPIAVRVLPAERFEPVAMVLEYTDSELEQQTTLDLRACQPPICRRDSAGIHVFPRLAMQLPAEIAVQDESPTAATVRFRVLFRYRSEGLYDHALLRSDWQQLAINNTPPLRVMGTLFFPETIFDNKNLAALWQTEDGAGLSQNAARQRLLAQRAALEPVYIGIGIAGLIALLLLCALLLYWRFYHRPFDPELAWLPLEDTTLDFNQLGSHVLLGRLLIHNRARVPWFGRLLRNQAQPRRRASLRLGHAPLLEHNGIALRDEQAVALGFLPPGDSDRRLVTTVDYEVTHESQFYLFIATETIADYHCADARLDPIEEIVPVQLRLDWRRAANDPTPVLAESLNVQLWLCRERAAPPLVHFKPLAETAYFIQAEPVQIGTFVFTSTANHRFSQPYVGRFDILANRSDAGPQDGTLTISENDVLSVEGKETIELEIVIFCDGRRIRYPYPVTDEYQFRLLGDFAPGSQTGPHAIELHRHLSGPGARTLERQRRRWREEHPDEATEAVSSPAPNPFHPGSALSDETSLPGRDAVIQSLLELIQNRSPAILCGHRRAGKTSLLNTLAERLAPEWAVYHVSLEGKKIGDADGLARLLVPAGTEPVSAEALRQQLTAQSQAVLLIDQVVFLKASAADTFAWLRDIGQHTASIVFAGAHWDWVQVVEHAAATPTSSFGNDVTPVSLGPLEPAEAMRFLVETAPDDVPIAQQRSAAWIIELCGCWPFYLQVMGYAVVQAVRAGTRLPLVERRGVVELYRRCLLQERNVVFQDRWAALPPGVHAVLLQVRAGRFPDYADLDRAGRKAVRDAGLCDAAGHWIEDRPLRDWVQMNLEDLSERG